jgi:hypothetical protein
VGGDAGGQRPVARNGGLHQRAVDALEVEVAVVYPFRDRVSAGAADHGVADPVAGADFSKQPARLARGHCLPGLEGAHRAGLHMAPARQADLGPMPCLIGFSPTMRNLSLSATMAMSSTRRDTSSERRSAPTKPNSSSAGSRRPRALSSQLAQHRQCQRGGFLRRTGMGAQRALQRALDVAMRRVPREIVEPVHFSQCRQPASDGGGGMAIGEAGQVGTDDRRRRRDRDKAVRSAPVGKCVQSAL